MTVWCVLGTLVMLFEPKWVALRRFSIYRITKPGTWWPGRMTLLDVASTCLSFLTFHTMYLRDSALLDITCQDAMLAFPQMNEAEPA